MSTPASIHAFLEEARVPYTIVPHETDRPAPLDAAGRPARGWAKVVICVADGEPIQAVLPPPLIVNLDWLSALAGASSIRFALPEESRTWFVDCEPDAMPPLGPLYGQRMFVDIALAAEFDIVFNAGTHRQAIRMRYADLAAATQPTIGRFAERPDPHERVTARQAVNWRAIFRGASRD
ncbi:MAG: YbaK/EbsC family protein [Acidobacteriota bacterium]